MGDFADEARSARFGFLERSSRSIHVVGQGRELGLVGARDTFVVVAAAEPGGRVAHRLDGTQDSAGDYSCDDRGDRDAGEHRER